MAVAQNQASAIFPPLVLISLFLDYGLGSLRCLRGEGTDYLGKKSFHFQGFPEEVAFKFYTFPVNQLPLN